MGPAHPIKALLDHSLPQIHQKDSGRHDINSRSQAAAPEADLLGFPTELRTEVVWRPVCEHDSEANRVALGEEQHQSERKDGQPQLQVESGLWQGQLSALPAQHQQWGNASRQAAQSEAGQELSLATSSHLLEYTQVESEFHGDTEANSSPVHDDMPKSGRHSCSTQSSPDRVRHLSEQAHREALLTPQSHNLALFSQDDQRLDMQSQYLPESHLQQHSRGVSSAGNRPRSDSRQIADHHNSMPTPKAQTGTLLSSKQQAGTAGNTALDQPSTGPAFRKHGEPQRAGTQACEVLPHGQQMLNPSHAGWVTTSEHLQPEARALPAKQSPADLGARDSQLQTLTAGAVPDTVPEYPAGAEAPSFSPDMEGPLSNSEPGSPSRKHPLLGAAPHSPDKTQPMLGSAPHSPDRGCDARASAGNSPAGTRKYSRPMASQQTATALEEGLSHSDAMVQGISNGVHARLGRLLIAVRSCSQHACDVIHFAHRVMSIYKN